MTTKKRNYRFNKEEHIHEIEIDGVWKVLTGCTTVLKVLAKPALIQWAANTSVDHIRENVARFYNEEFTVGDTGKHFDLNSFIEVLEEAKTAHCKKRDKAGDWGTKVHEEIERIINEAIDTNKGYVKEEVDANDSIYNFRLWAVNNKIRFLESEKNVYSEKLYVGGICDAVCEIDGKRWVLDIKTSKSGIYPENFWQVSCYDHLMQEMGEPKAEGYIILNIKNSGDFIEKRNISLEDNWDAFLACLKIYRIQESIKNNIL
jgi:hypothetical protein